VFFKQLFFKKIRLEGIFQEYFFIFSGYFYLNELDIDLTKSFSTGCG